MFCKVMQNTYENDFKKNKTKGTYIMMISLEEKKRFTDDLNQDHINWFVLKYKRTLTHEFR